MFPAGQYRNFPGSRFHVRVYSGGSANNTTVNSNGILYVSSGGTADNAIINSKGTLWVSSGGNMANWVELGRGVDMDWTVIA